MQGEEEEKEALEYIEPGSSIIIHGLNARPDLNGSDGIVLSYVPARERYHVKVCASSKEKKEEEEEVFLRPMNCRRSTSKKNKKNRAKVAAKERE